jgi:hypothetical protein
VPNIKMTTSTFSSSYGRLTEGQVYAVSKADAEHLVEQGLAEETKDKPTGAEPTATPPAEPTSQSTEQGTAITRDKAKQPQAEKT